MKRQMSVNYLTDGTIIKGYNEEGNLVAVYDNYENYARWSNTKHTEMLQGGRNIESRALYDNNNKQVSFAYRPFGQSFGNDYGYPRPQSIFRL